MYLKMRARIPKVSRWLSLLPLDNVITVTHITVWKISWHCHVDTYWVQSLRHHHVTVKGSVDILVMVSIGTVSRCTHELIYKVVHSGHITNSIFRWLNYTTLALHVFISGPRKPEGNCHFTAYDDWRNIYFMHQKASISERLTFFKASAVAYFPTDCIQSA